MRAGLGSVLRAYRERALLTQKQLADRSGVSVRTISGLERGQGRRPQLVTLRSLADGLGLTDQERAALTRAHAAPAPQPGRQLPMDVPGFTGRAEVLRQLDALLAGADGGQAVVIAAIAGTAGVGKTALAVHWAHRVADRFGDGQLFVDLRGWAPGAPVGPARALAQLLDGLGVPVDHVPVEVERAAAVYRSLLAGRRVLVVLDNARDADQVRPLLPGTPGSLVVVTSRDRLVGLVASHGAQRLTLNALTPGEAVALLARILGEPRVAGEPKAVAELATACGLLPLALRIAAANLACHPERSLAAYVTLLRQGDQLGELAVDGDPQAAVRAAFDCSYAALTPEDQRLFRLLGLVPGPEFTAAAAAALTGMPVPHAERALDRLAGGHLAEPRGPRRFGLHDLLRRYAGERAEREDDQQHRQAAVTRLLAWYLHASDTADRLLYPQILRLPVPAVPAGVPPAGFGQDAQALAWLDAEHANLVAAVQHAADHGPPRFAWLLGDALRNRLWGDRRMVDWLGVAHAGVRAATREGDSQAQAAAQRNLGMARLCLGEYKRAAEHHTSALALARQAGWVDGEAAALAALARVFTDMGELRQGADYFTQALALHRRLDSRAGQAVILSNLGDVTRQLGRPRRAVEQLTQALALFGELGTTSSQEGAVGTLGEAYHDLGELDAAAGHLGQALAVAREAGNRYVEASATASLAAVHRDAGRLPLALGLAHAALALAGEIDDRRVEADARNVLGSVHLRLGSDQAAAEEHRQALALARRSEARFPETRALLGLAAARQHQGRHAQAVDCAGQAIALARHGGYQVLEGQAHAALASVHLDQHHHDEAIQHARQALDLQPATGHRLGQARTLLVLGRALDGTGEAAAARSCWQDALVLLAEVGAPEADQARALLDGV